MIETIRLWWAAARVSRTMKFNMVCAVLFAAEGAFHLLQPVLPANVYSVLAFILIVGNMFLRTVTSQSLLDKIAR